MISTLVARGRQTRLIELRLVQLTSGEREELVDDGELCAVVLSGIVTAAVDRVPLGTAGARDDVFAGPGDAVYAPPGSSLMLEASAAAVVAVVSAPVDGGAPRAAARVIRAADQRITHAGVGNWSRTIRTLLGPEQDAGRLIVGETVNPPGNWSSYPPHKHDRHAPPEEVALEEVYFYRFKPEGGFGVQLVYGDGEERAQIVRDSEVVVIPSGYHPVVAAPGYALYYLWAMAGEGRELAPYLDPQHAWVQRSAS